ncbi:hypothetical protein HK407_04g08480 [Ordospora pajunii]|uniref:uncharacterized protein n=1 Tax=Ordospora pajunii TaxID=3039483 RepID=UPI0029529007|nr:uncharacterized protein HK407_04g08480 [Ordospora pajunii]KAH9411737.1 hypothetical protein HK407_04g08480 [Ordospora pajunii]
MGEEDATPIVTKQTGPEGLPHDLSEDTQKLIHSMVKGDATPIVTKQTGPEGLSNDRSEDIQALISVMNMPKAKATILIEDGRIRHLNLEGSLPQLRKSEYDTYYGYEMIEMGILVGLIIISILLNYFEVDGKVVRIAMLVTILLCFLYCLIRKTLLAPSDNIPSDTTGTLIYTSMYPMTLYPMCIILNELFGEEGNIDSFLYSKEGERLLLSKYTFMIIGIFILIQALNILDRCNDVTRANYVIRSSLICGFSGLLLFSGESSALFKYQNILAIILMVFLALHIAIDFTMSRMKKYKSNPNSDKLLKRGKMPYSLFYLTIFLSTMNVVNMFTDGSLDFIVIIKFLTDKLFPGLKFLDKVILTNSK